MKNKGLYIRLSQAEFDEVKAQGGKNRSAWIRKKLFPASFIVDTSSFVMDKLTAVREVEKPFIPIVETCRHPNCNNVANLYLIHGCKAYFCEVHKPL